MNRALKFRAWDGKSMRPVLSILWGANRPRIVGFAHTVKTYLVEDLELMQYTGLRDKNGVRIYESDVVAMFGNTQRSEVVWDLGAWMIYLVESGAQEGESLDLLFNHTDICEVIGNINENPELLEASDGK